MNFLNFEFTNIAYFSALLLLPLIYFLIKFSPPIFKKIFFFGNIFINEKEVKHSINWPLLVTRSLIYIFLILILAGQFFLKQNKLNNFKHQLIIIENDFLHGDKARNIGGFLEKYISKFPDDTKFSFIQGNEEIENKSLLNKAAAFEYLANLQLSNKQIDRYKLKNDLVKFKNENLDFYTLYISNFLSSYSRKYYDIADLIFIDEIKKIKDKALLDYDYEYQFIRNISIEGDMLKIDLEFINYEVDKIGLEIFYHNYEREEKIVEINDNNQAYLTLPIYKINDIKFVKLFKNSTLYKRNFTNQIGEYFLFGKSDKEINVSFIKDLSKDESLLTDEYYLINALRNRANIVDFSPEILKNNNIDIIFLAAKENLPTELNDELMNFVNNGGILFRFASDIKFAHDELMPTGKFKVIRDYSINSEIKENEIENINSLTFDNNFFTEDFNNIKIYKHYLTSNNDAMKLISLGDNTALLSMKKYEKGAIYFLHTGLTDEWSNISLHEFFPYLINKIADLAQNNNIVTGNEFTLHEELLADGLFRISNDDTKYNKDEFYNGDLPPGFYKSKNNIFAKNILPEKYIAKEIIDKNIFPRLYEIGKISNFNFVQYVFSIMLLMIIFELLFTLFYLFRSES